MSRRIDGSKPALLLAAGLVLCLGITKAAGGCATPPSGLLDWWPADGDARDIVGSNDGTLLNGTTFATGMVGAAFSFDGVTNVVQVGAASVAPPWSAEFWINRQDSLDSSAVLLGDAATALKLEQFPATRKLGLTQWGVNDYTFNYGAPTGVWVHVVFVGTTSSTQLYVNGALQDTQPVSLSLPRGQIGNDIGGRSSKRLKGLVDETSLYGRALAPGEIQTLYSAGAAGKCHTNNCVTPPAGLVDWWPADGDATDLAGSNNGTLLNGTTFAVGMVGSAFSFDGLTNVVQGGASPLPAPWSAEFWVNRQNSLDDSAVLLGDSATALKLEQYPNTRKLGFTQWGTGDYTFNYGTPAGVWVHLVFVGTATNTQLYVNGALQDTQPVSIALPRGQLGNDISGRFIKRLKGLVDETSLYNRALSSFEIQGLYGAGAAGKCHPVAATNPPVFLFSSPTYQVNENAGAVTVAVLNSGDLPGSVSYQTLNGTAQGGSGFSGDYTITTGNLSLGGHQSTNLSIQILDNFLDRPDIQFQVQLLFPSPGASLGSPSTATITIHENDVNGATNSLLNVALPTPQPLMNGQLTVSLTPPEAGGQWRFPWDVGWRTNRQLVSNLAPGDYPIEFRSLSNYVAYPGTVTLTVPNNGAASWGETFYPGFGPSGPSDTGSLTVNIAPNAPPGAGWRFVGESGWRDPGSTVSGLLPDTYFLEFAQVTNWSKPGDLAIPIAGGSSESVLENYLSPASPGGAALPVPVPGNALNDLSHYPYGFNGQLQTDVGYGSGVAVRESIVLTAAHMVFDDQTLTFVKQAYWSFQAETGAFQPEPLPARGWFMLSGYARQRTNDLPPIGNLGPDQSSPQSRDVDVAALYFLNPAARTGSGGYLASDAVPNPWLTGSNLKMVVGYPVDGSFFGQTVQPGTMYVTPSLPDSRPFTMLTNQTYGASWLLSYPGNSGGPVYVEVPYSGGTYYFPAAVYLGTLYNGGSYQSVVRAIDSTVVNIINLAESEGDTGTNNSGGVITIRAGSGSGLLAYVQVVIEPAAAVAAGAAWRVAGTSSWSEDPSYTATFTSGQSVTLEYKPIPGWNLPNNNSVTVSLGTLTTNYATYSLIPAQLALSPAAGLSSTGHVGGLFSPTNGTYTLTNLGGASLSWTATAASNWVTLSATNGTLAAGTRTNVTVLINAIGTSLAAGVYTNKIGFTNLSNGQGNTARSVSLTVYPPIRLANPRVLSNGGVVMTLQGATNRVYAIQISSNLTDWADSSPLVTNTTGATIITNLPPGNAQRRFYRAKEEPL